MPKKLALRIDSSLSAALQQCLPTLQAVSLSLETYGTEVDATRMHDVIERLRSLFPSGTSKTAYPMEFMVNGTFKVSRQQVATALGHAFTGEVTWFRITEMVPPRELRFRSIDQTSPRVVDYPLNEGGAVRIVTTESNAAALELRLDLIAAGLEVLANYYPRHFVDLVNENADAITADALLQCCLFGELIYG